MPVTKVSPNSGHGDGHAARWRGRISASSHFRPGVRGTPITLPMVVCRDLCSMYVRKGKVDPSRSSQLCRRIAHRWMLTIGAVEVFKGDTGRPQRTEMFVAPDLSIRGAGSTTDAPVERQDSSVGGRRVRNQGRPPSPGRSPGSGQPHGAWRRCWRCDYGRSLD